MSHTILLCLALACGLVYSQTTQQPVSTTCDDLDTGGCQSFYKANPNLCNEPLFAQSTCRRFCGNCPVECYNCPYSLTDPDDCNITSLCAPHEACMTKHLRANDGHHEYIMTCEKKEVCSGLQFGFVGKRSPFDGFEDSGATGNRAERNIEIDCCETDLCNAPLLATTTTSPPPTMKTTKPTGKTTVKATSTAPTTACHKDVVFMIDDSGSVGRTNFQHSVDFVSQLVSHMRVGQTGHSAQVSVMAFSSYPQIEWYLDTYHTQTDLQNALQHRVKYVSGETNTGKALDAVITKILSSHKGDRHDAENVVVLLTDGRSDDHTLHEAHSLHSESHDVISIGIGRDPSNQELQYIATDRQHTFHIAGYSQLPNIAQHVLSLICN